MLKGHLKTLLDSLKKWSCWDEAIFAQKLGDLIQRKSASDLDGAHMRLLAEMYREVILPALTTCPADVYSRVEQLFEGWSEVPTIMLHTNESNDSRRSSGPCTYLQLLEQCQRYVCACMFSVGITCSSAKSFFPSHCSSVTAVPYKRCARRVFPPTSSGRRSESSGEVLAKLRKKW